MKVCIDCNKKVSFYAIRCKSCARKGSNNPMFGKSVLKGKKWEEFRSTESIKNSKSYLNKGLNFGHKHSEETKKKIGVAVTGEKNGFFGKKHTKETKNNIREKIFKQYQEGRTKNARTSIELKIEKCLIELNIKYTPQEKFGYWLFDFYLPEHDSFIECDGDYWHANPIFYTKDKLNETQQKNLKNDRKKSTFLKNKSKRLFRVWEYDINKNIDNVKKDILTFLNDTSDTSNNTIRRISSKI